MKICFIAAGIVPPWNVKCWWVKYMIKDGETGMLFKNGDVKELQRKIMLMIEHPKVRKELKRNAKSFVCCTYRTSEIKKRFDFLNLL